MEKGSGILLHISSLPSRYGIGTFGKEARRFVRFLNASGQKYWQLLPLNPTSYGDSPYQSFSAFALNPYFIDLDILYKKGWLTKEELKSIKNPRKSRFVDYGYIYDTRFTILRKAYKRAFKVENEKIAKFYRREKKWLKDYALFMCIKGLYNDIAFALWPRDLRLHKASALKEIEKEHEDDINFWIFVQYEAYRQYISLKKYAKRKNVQIIGDMPIYVSADSADVWGNSRYFKLNRERRPTLVAGVPPDYFSEDGQLWGNPLYKWDAMAKNHFAWWKQRAKKMAKLYDYIRIDHFRGFESYYAVPSKEKTAKNGAWEKGPGIAFFDEVLSSVPHLHIIAEDLGIITKEVDDLMKQTGFPGLKVYQFAFSDYESCLNKKEPIISKEQTQLLTPREQKELKLTNGYLPHHYIANCVAYIGTHDNDVLTSYLKEHKNEIPYMMDYLNLDNEKDVYDTLIGSLMRSSAGVVIYTIQDLLKLDGFSRMNTPGTGTGNWRFRVLRNECSKELASWLKAMTIEAKRI